MQKLVVVFAVGILTSGWAGASDKSDAVAVINQWVDAFNKGDMQALAATCADEAVVVDAIAPFEWHGAGACSKWSDAYGAFAKSHEITDATVTYDKPRHVYVSGDTAYVTASATYAGTEKGKPAKEPAMVTTVLKKIGSGWRITAITYSAR
jgi:ketosteroid isomerase-like protein